MTFTDITFRTLQKYTLTIERIIETIEVVQCAEAIIIVHLIEEEEVEGVLTTLEIAIIHQGLETMSSRGQIDTIRILILPHQDHLIVRIQTIVTITIITSRIDYQTT